MDTMIDLIGSMVVASLIMLAVLKMNAGLSDAGSDTNVSVITQSNVTQIANSINYDFYKIGFRASPAILFADSNKIVFRADLEKTGSPDTVRYWVSTPIQGSGLNPNMRILYRSINSDPPTGASLGQTKFLLNYYDSTGAIMNIPAADTTNLSVLSRIKSIRVTVKVESPNKLMSDSTYAGAYWQEFISPKNLRTLM